MAKTYEANWEITDNLSETGQSYTFLVKDKREESESLYVLKRNKNPKRVLRFRKEIEALQQLEHLNIIKILAYDLEDENPWYIQEYYEGGDLQKYVEENPDISWETAFDIFITVCEIIAYCHSKGVYHRDIKPANIFLKEDGDEVALGDFGLAWIDFGDGRATETEEAVGSRFYMAPEYADGKVGEPTASGDIYSLGKVLYFLFSRGRRFDREKHREERWNIVLQQGKPSPENPNNLFLEHLNLLLDQMILENPDKRIEIDVVLKHAQLARRMVLERFNLIEGSAKYAPCKYCGKGYYQTVAPAAGHFQSYLGLPTSTQAPITKFRALECDNCGHVQIFRAESEKKDWIARN